MSKIIEKCPIFVKKISKVEFVTWFCVFAFYFNDQSSNPAEANILGLKRMKIKKKRLRLTHLKN